jgi:DNA-binding protein YbaB
MLEDLLVAATNQALRKVKQQVAEQSTKTALGMSLPPELGTP